MEEITRPCPSTPSASVFVDRGVGLAALPPEGWGMILDNLKTAKDYHNCSRVCQLFEDLLEHRKKFWGFHLVLPLILPRLGLEGTLNCRCVCQDWKNAVDKMIENAPQNRPYNAEEHDNHPLLNIGWTNRNPLRNLVKPVSLHSTDSVRTLHQQLQAHPQCKVIGGSFVVGCQQVDNNNDVDDDDENRAERISSLYWQNFYHLSKLFGGQILSLRLNDRFTEAFGSVQLQYMYIRTILQNCPNMRKLHLDFYRFSPYSFAAAAVEETRIGFVPVAYPLPNMPQLESMVLRNAIWIPLKLALLDKYSEQLKWLKCTLCSSIPDAVMQKMSVITELAVRINNNAVDTTCDAILRKLLLIPSRKLENLVLQMGDQETRATGLDFSLRTLLDIIATFSLKILRVGGGAVDLSLEESECPVALRRRVASLKILEFFDTSGVPSFNFLECFPSLEQLVVKAYYPMPPPQPGPLSYLAILFGQLYAQPQQLIHPKLAFNQTIAEKLNLRENLYNSVDDEKILYQSALWKEMRHLKRIDFSYNWIHVTPNRVGARIRRTFTRDEFRKHTAGI